ncbi:hypothetical protein NRI_0225 [Neorickettsia risticii str. Illinois]|uniref:Uncharacterized protein n=1 Tax=Neorickettsia risticii (strain Illinois) TaxID=434131 RepID=C6V4A0_NEORI|nr:hypothetical protein NRI_0225 [Neorickettsia risticii str. Illinois]
MCPSSTSFAFVSEVMKFTSGLFRRCLNTTGKWYFKGEVMQKGCTCGKYSKKML